MPERGSSSPPATDALRRRALTDRCWGVPFAVASSAFLLVMVSSCYGYLAVLFMEKYAINHEQVSRISSALVIAHSSSGLLVSQLQRKLSVYHISLLGGVLASSGLVSSAFAPSVGWMTFTFGVLYGTGIGTALLGLSLYLLMYFEEYRGTATAIMWIFRATSGMAAMPLLWKLTEIYGVQGCLLIAGGMVMHVVPIIMLIKHPQPCLLRFSKSAVQDTKDPATLSKKSAENGGKDSAPPYSQPQQPPSTPNEKKLTTSTSSVNNVTQVALASFRSFPFYVMVLFSVVTEYVFVTFSMTVVAYAVDKGWKLQNGNQLVIYNAVGLLAGRLVAPFATDKIRSSRCPVAVASLSSAAGLFLLLPVVKTFVGLAVLTCVMGVGMGYILCIKTVLMGDYMVVEGVSFCCGVAGILAIPVWIAGPSIIGFFRDTRGSYDLLYVTFSALSLFVAAMLLILACRDAAGRRRQLGDSDRSGGATEMKAANKPKVLGVEEKVARF
uniref:Putative monocarboxylate transporter ixodes scapularis monocarboxylate transporter n=1 Tax=Amblyomma triste TaxID=251400 RepID=A0A023GMX3_AMBTT